MQYLVSEYTSLPQEPGIYLFLNNKGEILYVGKAKDLKKRVSSYFVSGREIGEKTLQMLSQATKIQIIPVESEIESLLLEANYIKKYAPKYNVRLTDGKSYPLIEITKESFPKVLFVRKMYHKKSLYFGPYPNVGSLKLVLKTIRRIFPFESVSKHQKRICLYYHLGLCPCASFFNTTLSKQQYKKTISYITSFLRGGSKKVIQQLKKERDELVVKEQFEDAQEIHRKIEAVTLVTQPVRKALEYETNPNLKTDLRQKELHDLQSLLALSSLPQRIECFDISHIQGTNITASLVVFTQGEKDSQWYRRFKIRLSGSIGKPNDFAAMEEVIIRRLKHAEWPMPHLIMVDGGKGQVSSALKALEQSQASIPVIGLAKREEIIITKDLLEVKIPKNKPALQLLMRIRNEAHRFAITYHRKLRSKTFLKK